MIILNKETQKEVELNYRSPSYDTCEDMTVDMVCNNDFDSLLDLPDDYCGDARHMMSAEAIEWWESFFTRMDEAEDKLVALRNSLDCHDELDDHINSLLGNYDLEQQPEVLSNACDEWVK